MSVASIIFLSNRVDLDGSTLNKAIGRIHSLLCLALTHILSCIPSFTSKYVWLSIRTDSVLGIGQTMLKIVGPVPHSLSTSTHTHSYTYTTTHVDSNVQTCVQMCTHRHRWTHNTQTHTHVQKCQCMQTWIKSHHQVWRTKHSLT